MNVNFLHKACARCVGVFKRPTGGNILRQTHYASGCARRVQSFARLTSFATNFSFVLEACNASFHDCCDSRAACNSDPQRMVAFAAPNRYLRSTLRSASMFGNFGLDANCKLAISSDIRFPCRQYFHAEFMGIPM